jgi:hypothetical protein
MQDKIIKVTPNSARAKEIIAERAARQRKEIDFRRRQVARTEIENVMVMGEIVNQQSALLRSCYFCLSEVWILVLILPLLADL